MLPKEPLDCLSTLRLHANLSGSEHQFEGRRRSGDSIDPFDVQGVPRGSLDFEAPDHAHSEVEEGHPGKGLAQALPPSDAKHRDL